MFAQEYLYSNLVYDYYADLDQPPNIERQIHVLAEALDSPRWFDFRRAENQMIASLFHTSDPAIARIFFHQLMLSMQLLLNIRKSGLSREYKIFLFNELPERVAWSVALAQLWKENCAIAKVSHRDEDFILGPYGIIFRRRSHQVERLKEFGRSLKWPRMSHVDKDLKEDYHEMVPLEERSMESMTWLSGLVMPGNCTPWAIMSALLDCDRDAVRGLENFMLFLPSFGFQYRASSYWYWECIVAKVMAAAKGVNQVVGWVGPVCFSSDLARTQCAPINQYAAPHRLDRRVVRTMESRSDPLGPVADDYPVQDFCFPRLKSQPIETLRFQRLEFKPAYYDDTIKSTVYDSCVVFVIAGFFSYTIPIRLRYNVSFIAAPPCNSGPHVLCHEYAYQTVAVDQIWRLNFWGGGCVCPLDRKGPKCKHRVNHPDLFDEENVLVVRAFGSADNDVFARAWCSYIGLSAVVASIKDTCVACAVRNAYAARVAVVILIDGKEGR